jgi:hypothetical protein
MNTDEATVFIVSYINTLNPVPEIIIYKVGLDLKIRFTIQNKTLTLYNPPYTPDIIKRNIERILHPSETDECPVCYQLINDIITCDQCSQKYCLNCHVEIWRHSFRAICPMCRFCVDEQDPENTSRNIEEFIQRCSS